MVQRFTARPGTTATAGYFRSRWLPFVFLAPTLLSLGIFLYYPSVQTVTLSLLARRRPLPQERFVCLNNYVALAEDIIYRNSFLTTLFITVAIVLLAMGLSLGIALLASQKVRGASIYRTLLIWPFALSPVVAGAIFLALFREGSSGLINYALERGLNLSVSWLRDASLAPWVIVAASVWNILGFNILFYVAGLQNVPTDLLEAAQIDGANKLQRFIRITFPMLAPFTFFLLVTNVTYSFYGVYGAVDTLTQGGPTVGAGGALGGATNVLIYKLYDDAFSPGGSIGLAAAQAIVLFLIVAGLTLLQFRYIENRITYSG
ncbi:MAG: sugar ABC transporter permease [Armatimonadetes bacterium]|nr:sugar ABC transporter permease [Anaerolineae bacterium]